MVIQQMSMNKPNVFLWQPYLVLYFHVYPFRIVLPYFSDHNDRIQCFLNTARWGSARKNDQSFYTHYSSWEVYYYNIETQRGEWRMIFHVSRWNNNIFICIWSCIVGKAIANPYQNTYHHIRISDVLFRNRKVISFAKKQLSYKPESLGKPRFLVFCFK